MSHIFSTLLAKQSSAASADSSGTTIDATRTGHGDAVEFVDLCKRYDHTVALDRVNLAIEPGEFVSLLGPSGSGKSTLLMVLAGFEEPSSGDVRVGGRSVTRIPAQRRDQGVVFQSYALFPHMTVAENVAYPLKARGVSQRAQRELVSSALQRVRMGGFADRRPSQLSGGQQQRVALARAIVFDPPLILMDESLSALDRRLRQEMQYELKELHRTLGKTIVYVTHDQEEAMVMSDRIALMRDGRLVQTAAPAQIYDDPVDRFAAGFLGDANFIEGMVDEIGDGCVRVSAGQGLFIDGKSQAGFAKGDQAVCMIRPESVELLAPGTVNLSPKSACSAHALIQRVAFLGDSLRYRVAWCGATLDVKAPRVAGSAVFREGDPVQVKLDDSRVRIVRP